MINANSEETRDDPGLLIIGTANESAVLDSWET